MSVVDLDSVEETDQSFCVTLNMCVCVFKSAASSQTHIVHVLLAIFISFFIDLIYVNKTETIYKLLILSK